MILDQEIRELEITRVFQNVKFVFLGPLCTFLLRRRTEEASFLEETPGYGPAALPHYSADAGLKENGLGRGPAPLKTAPPIKAIGSMFNQPAV